MITKPAGITEARRPKHPHNQDLKPQLYLGATDQGDLMLSKTTQYPTRRSVSKEKKYTTAQNHWLNIKLSDICVFYPFFPETTSVLMTMGYFRCRTKMASKMRRMGSSSARFQEVQDNIFINRFFKRLQQKAKNEVFVHITGIDVVLFWGEEGYLVWPTAWILQSWAHVYSGNHMQDHIHLTKQISCTCFLCARTLWKRLSIWVSISY